MNLMFLVNGNSRVGIHHEPALNNARRVVAQHGYRDPFWVSKDWYISSARFDISLYLSPWVAEAVLAVFPDCISTKMSKFEMVPAVGGSPNGGRGVKVSIVDS
ncbi:Uncharacterized protein HZ326_5817 [Fusarium oxysporum f. sp. albedinis]|nr:Uncharacterized protein HZ326_5817 [Fusarium oxysporum f. sp. albedinis]